MILQKWLSKSLIFVWCLWAHIFDVKVASRTVWIFGLNIELKLYRKKFGRIIGSLTIQNELTSWVGDKALKVLEVHTAWKFSVMLQKWLPKSLLSVWRLRSHIFNTKVASRVVWVYGLNIELKLYRKKVWQNHRLTHNSN